MTELEKKLDRLGEKMKNELEGNYWDDEIDSGVLDFQKMVFDEVLDSGDEYCMEQFMRYCYPDESQQVRIAKAMKNSYYIYGVLEYCHPCQKAVRILLPKMTDSHYILRILTGDIQIPKKIRKKLINRLQECNRAQLIGSGCATTQERAELVRSLKSQYLIKELLRWGDTLSQNNRKILERKLRQA